MGRKKADAHADAAMARHLTRIFKAKAMSAPESSWLSVARDVLRCPVSAALSHAQQLRGRQGVKLLERLVRSVGKPGLRTEAALELVIEGLPAYRDFGRALISKEGGAA